MKGNLQREWSCQRFFSSTLSGRLCDSRQPAATYTPLLPSVMSVGRPENRLELDPNRRIREALDLAFRKFTEFGSVRQVTLWLIDESDQDAGNRFTARKVG